MNKEIVAKWDKNKNVLENYFKTTKMNQYSDYSAIVHLVVDLVLNEKEEFPDWDSTQITEIDHGEYQGTKIYLFHKSTYQPSLSDYAIVDVSYGSCSGCDTLCAIQEYGEELPTDEQVKDHMTLALHIIQSIMLFSDLPIESSIF